MYLIITIIPLQTITFKYYPLKTIPPLVPFKIDFWSLISKSLPHLPPNSTFIILTKKYFREKVANKNFACCAISALLHPQCGKYQITPSFLISKNQLYEIIFREWIYVFSTLCVPTFATKYIDNFISHIIHINSSHFFDKNRNSNIELLKQV